MKDQNIIHKSEYIELLHAVISLNIFNIIGTFIHNDVFMYSLSGLDIFQQKKIGTN